MATLPDEIPITVRLDAEDLARLERILARFEAAAEKLDKPLLVAVGASAAVLLAGDK